MGIGSITRPAFGVSLSRAGDGGCFWAGTEITVILDDLGIEDSRITLAFTDDVPNHPDRSGP
jgi:hypothetical protein